MGKTFENIVGKGQDAGNQHFSFSHIVKKFVLWYQVNSLPNDKNIDWFKLKTFTDNNSNVAWPFPKWKILDSSKLKEFWDDNQILMKMEESYPNG